MDEREFDDFLEAYRWRYAIEDPRILDWTREMRIRPRITDPPVRDARPNAPARNTVIFGPTGETLAHPDRSIELVVLDERPSEAALAEARRVARDAVVVWARDGTLSADWLREPEASSPGVSVIVHPGSGGGLEACLKSLSETTPSVEAIEISVAACNAGADAARGDFLVFVSEDTLARPGWLRPLVRTLWQEPDVGVVGGKVLSDDGTLEQAGGVIFADGSRASFGSGAGDPNAPLYEFARDVHYVSDDLLATRAALFRNLGGFDSLLLGSGYADVDYCLRVRAAGRRVVYQPETAVVRHTQPRDGRAHPGRDVFVRRWTSVLANLPAPPKCFDDATWDRLARVA